MKRALILPLCLAVAACSAACSSASGADSKATACENMKRVIVGFGVSGSDDPTAAATAYARAAASLRSDVRTVGDDAVKTSAEKVADVLDGLADDMRALATGNPRTPRVDQLTTSVSALQQACS